MYKVIFLSLFIFAGCKSSPNYLYGEWDVLSQAPIKNDGNTKGKLVINNKIFSLKVSDLSLDSKWVKKEVNLKQLGLSSKHSEHGVISVDSYDFYWAKSDQDELILEIIKPRAEYRTFFLKKIK